MSFINWLLADFRAVRALYIIYPHSRPSTNITPFTQLAQWLPRLVPPKPAPPPQTPPQTTTSPTSPPPASQNPLASAFIRTGTRKPTKNKAAASIFATTTRNHKQPGSKQPSRSTDAAAATDEKETANAKPETKTAPPRNQKIAWKTVPAPEPAFYFISFMADQRNMQYPWAMTRQCFAKVQGRK